MKNNNTLQRFHQVFVHFACVFLLSAVRGELFRAAGLRSGSFFILSASDCCNVKKTVNPTGFHHLVVLPVTASGVELLNSHEKKQTSFLYCCGLFLYQIPGSIESVAHQNCVFKKYMFSIGVCTRQALVKLSVLIDCVGICVCVIWAWLKKCSWL